MSSQHSPLSFPAGDELSTPHPSLLPEAGLPHRDLMLGLNHPYFCSDCNYHSNEANLAFDTVADFLDHFDAMPVELNLCFRWDIRRKDEDQPEKGYRAEVFLMLQRKGLFIPCSIDSISECDLPRLEKYLATHWKMIQAIWTPFSNAPNDYIP